MSRDVKGMLLLSIAVGGHDCRALSPIAPGQVLQVGARKLEEGWHFKAVGMARINGDAAGEE